MLQMHKTLQQTRRYNTGHLWPKARQKEALYREL